MFQTFHLCNTIEVSATQTNSNFAGFVGVVALITVAGIHAFHINITVIDLIGQSGLQEQFDLGVLDRATLHRQQVANAFFEHPNSSVIETNLE